MNIFILKQGTSEQIFLIKNFTFFQVSNFLPQIPEKIEVTDVR